MYMYRYTYMYRDTYMYRYTYMYRDTYMYRYTHAHTHTHTHTHIYTRTYLLRGSGQACALKVERDTGQLRLVRAYHYLFLLLVQFHPHHAHLFVLCVVLWYVMLCYVMLCCLVCAYTYLDAGTGDDGRTTTTTKPTTTTTKPTTTTQYNNTAHIPGCRDRR